MKVYTIIFKYYSYAKVIAGTPMKINTKFLIQFSFEENLDHRIVKIMVINFEYE